MRGGVREGLKGKELKLKEKGGERKEKEVRS